MKILGSTQYVDLKTQKESWYQLEVTNMWDFKTKSICFQTFENGHTIGYHLKIKTPISETSYNSQTIEFITDEMKVALIEKGLTLSNRINQ